jgi:4-hydroxy-tetrahydrodipicolinate synthase
MPRFGRVLTAMVTPFTRDGALDTVGAAELARWLVAQGNEGLVVAGTTGESPTISREEQAELIEAVTDAVDVPVIAGTGSNDTASARWNTEQATAAGADAILLVTPYYNRPSQAGLVDHFTSLSECTDLPIMLYDIPGRTGRKIETATIEKLSLIPNVVALKDAAGDPAETARLIAAVDEDFEVYSGDDALTLALLAVGAVGAVGVATHWVAAETVAMIDAFESGDVAAARSLNQRMLESYEFESQADAPNPVPAKAVLRALGQPAGPCRAPMGPEPDGLASAATAMLERINAQRKAAK